jgi:hypothetical protein
MRNIFLSNKLTSEYLELFSKLDKIEIKNNLILQILLKSELLEFPLNGIGKFEFNEIVCLYMDFIFINVVHENKELRFIEEKNTWNEIISKSNFRFTQINGVTNSEIKKVEVLNQLITKGHFDITIREILNVFEYELGMALYRQEGLPSPFRNKVTFPEKLYSDCKVGFFTSYLDKRSSY